MPYYPEGKELKDACKKLRLYSVCAECGGRLVVRYDLIEHREYIICNENEAHEGIRNTWAETLKQIREEISMDSIALMKLDEGGMLARIDTAKFPQALKAEEKKWIAEMALSYGLDPIMNELSIYQGRPYPTVNAWYRKAQETGKFDGMNSRPANQQERKERNAKEGDYLYCVEVWRKGSAHPFVGWGRVRAEETKGDPHLPIVKDPDRMAEKRGEMQGMRKAFSIPMPPMSFEEATDTYVEGVGKVIKATGEIIEGEVVVRKAEESTLETPVTAVPEPETTIERDESPITEEQGKELQALVTQVGSSMGEIWKVCTKENWKITKLGDLKVWQLEELKGRLAKGKEQPPLV